MISHLLYKNRDPYIIRQLAQAMSSSAKFQLVAK